METIGSKGLLKKSEFIRIIIDALSSLGFGDIAASLEKRSGIFLHSPIVTNFLDLVKKGEWDKSIEALQGFELRDDKPVKFFLLEQKFLALLNMGNARDALRTLREEIVPLDVYENRIPKLAIKLIIPSGEDAESVNSSSKVVQKLQKLFPPAVLFPEKKLEYLLEMILDLQRRHCNFHNIPDSDLTVCSGHRCDQRKIPTETVQILEGHTHDVLFLKFSHNGKLLASSSSDNSAIIWEIDAQGKFSQKHKLVGHKKPVVVVLWSPDDRQVITCGENEVIRRWDVGSGEFVRSYERNGLASLSCGWVHDGSGIIGAMADRRIYMWNLDGTELQHEQDERANNLFDVAMTTDGKWLVSVGKEGNEISLFDRETGAENKLIPGKRDIASFSLSKDNSHLLIDLDTYEIQIWNIQGQPYKVLEFDGHRRKRFTLRSCFGGYAESFIASGSENELVYIWHVREQKTPYRVLQGHSEAVNCVSWSPTDLHMLASASDDRTIRIWGLDKTLDVVQWW
ncbi:WD repeat-containing protein 26 homolog [Eutrema salsugineum]|uniref:WD repeat-containing protein 26 homolog n=1 Tax=Eutrema salsugineum TaxID=72664 RepID=UPI000CED4B69|nr:WD repeat-containing protein 26 homolog [Eutrema salsugineum]